MIQCQASVGYIKGVSIDSGACMVTSEVGKSPHTLVEVQHAAIWLCGWLWCELTYTTHQPIHKECPANLYNCSVYGAWSGTNLSIQRKLVLMVMITWSKSLST